MSERASEPKVTSFAGLTFSSAREDQGVRPQRRGRKIAMSPAEVDTYLSTARTCRVATISPDGPHATPLWFVWLHRQLWLYSLSRSQRWADLQRDPRVGIVVDGGHEYLDLHGVEISGRATAVGEVPRTGEPVSEAESDLDVVEQEFAGKYFGGGGLHHDGRHGWLRVTPAKIASWDFRKLTE